MHVWMCVRALDKAVVSVKRAEPLNVLIQVCMHMYIRVCIYIYVCMYVCVYVCMYVCVRDLDKRGL